MGDGADLSTRLLIPSSFLFTIKALLLIFEPLSLLRA